MANLSLTRVNQKLNQAKLIAQDVQVDNLAPIALSAVVEAVAFHLMCAYQHYLRELAEIYGLKMASTISSETDLKIAFEAAKKYPVEVNELIELRNDRHSWLGQLSSYYNSLWLPPKIRAQYPKEEELTSTLIAAVSIDTETELSELTLASVQQWQVEFSSLVTRHRQTNAEF